MGSVGIANRIKEFLDQGNWKYSYDEENNTFSFGVAMGNSIKNIRMLVVAEETSFWTKAILPIGADMTDIKQSYEVMKFVCQVNYSLKNGNFEIDLNDGEIGYKSFVDCEDVEDISLKVIENSIICPAVMFKRYTAGFEDIIFKGASAEDAYKKSEKGHLDMLMKLLSDLEDSIPDGRKREEGSQMESVRESLLSNDCCS